MRMTRMVGVWLVGGLLALAGCIGPGLYGIKVYTPAAPALSDGRFAITFNTKMRPSTGENNKDYLFAVTVENVSGQEATLDSGELDLNDLETGITYFSISKDTTSVTLSQQRSDVITRRTLKPGQKIEGRFWFQTPAGKATAKRFELKLGSATVLFQE